MEKMQGRAGGEERGEGGGRIERTRKWKEK